MDCDVCQGTGLREGGDDIYNVDCEACYGTGVNPGCECPMCNGESNNDGA